MDKAKSKVIAISPNQPGRCSRALEHFLTPELLVIENLPSERIGKSSTKITYARLPGYCTLVRDMAIVERVSHHVAVMYLGRIVEIGPRAAIYENPQHAYTKALMLAMPIADPTTRKLQGDLNFKPIPSPIHPLNFRPKPSTYTAVGVDHLVLCDT